MCESHALSEAAVEKSSSFILLGDLSYLLTVFSAVSVSLFFFFLSLYTQASKNNSTHQTVLQRHRRMYIVFTWNRAGIILDIISPGTGAIF